MFGNHWAREIVGLTLYKGDSRSVLLSPHHAGFPVSNASLQLNFQSQISAALNFCPGSSRFLPIAPAACPQHQRGQHQHTESSPLQSWGSRAASLCSCLHAGPALVVFRDICSLTQLQNTQRTERFLGLFNAMLKQEANEASCLFVKGYMGGSPSCPQRSSQTASHCRSSHPGVGLSDASSAFEGKHAAQSPFLL